MFLSYHGTTYKNMQNIIKDGFKPLYGTRYGITYGKGIYTSKNIEEAVMYSEEGLKCVLICKIKTENYIKIKSTTKYKKYSLAKYDLVIIDDGAEYLVHDLSKIEVIGLIYYDVDIETTFGQTTYKNINIKEKVLF